MGPTTTTTHRTTRPKPHQPIRRPQRTRPGEPPRTQRTRTRRTHQQTRTQRHLDAIHVDTYREQAASVQHPRPSQTLGQETDREGRTPTGHAHVGVAHEEEQPTPATPRSRSPQLTPTYPRSSHGTSLNICPPTRQDNLTKANRRIDLSRKIDRDRTYTEAPVRAGGEIPKAMSGSADPIDAMAVGSVGIFVTIRAWLRQFRR
jgi:hypothetical protein